MKSVVFFFFFQAEDGIRDVTVTGVQTCALPISPDRGAPRHPGLPRPARQDRQGLAAQPEAAPPSGLLRLSRPFDLGNRQLPGAFGRADHPVAERLRSEEHTSELQSQSNLVCRLL